MATINMPDSPSNDLQYDMILAATLNNDDTEVKIQYRTSYICSANVEEVRAYLEGAIEFLCSITRRQSEIKHCDSLYDAYVYHIIGTDEASALEEWKSRFTDLDAGSHFPALPYPAHKSHVAASVSYTIESLSWRDDYQTNTQVLASWALLQASYRGSSDALIGTGPLGSEYGTKTGAILPMQIPVALDQPVSSYLDVVQSTIKTYQALPKLSQYRLRDLGDDLALACDFQTILSIDNEPGPTVLPDSGRALSLQIHALASGAHLVANFDQRSISTEQVHRLFPQLETVIRQICSSATTFTTVAEIETVSKGDLDHIASWNQKLWPNAQDLVHDLISRRAETMPDAPAISSWDGNLTYRQIDRLSTRLAHRLVQLGVKTEVVVPIYSEKSMWVPVSAVAVLKAGGTGVMIDCNEAIERACGIVSRVSANIVLTSPSSYERATEFSGTQLFVVDQAQMDLLPDPETGLSLPRDVQPSNLAYISFTSGSTGLPKGAMITHSCFTSSIRHQQQSLGFIAGQRVNDFASYAFDVSWSNLLHSLTSGCCLCIPSEFQRKNALSDSIRDTRATLINATPTVLRHLDPKELPDLEQIIMGGEAWDEADFVDWIDNKRLINGYGPGECTIKACLLRVVRGRTPNTIGKGIGVTTWIVRTDGSNRLAPLGSVGELWLEGPQVARGYLGDEIRTAASFVERPRWTQAQGPVCRFYRTGDLARYDADGALIFVSRIDSQVKIRGQRTELGEIEHSIQRALLAGDLKAQVVVDVFKPHRSNNPVLVAFMQTEEEDAWQKLMGVNEHLARLVPEYMIPTVYVPVDTFPMTATGKIHRQSLRMIYTKMTLEQLVARDALRVSAHRMPNSASEKLLQVLWAEVLHIDADIISAEDSFLRIGGDSLGVMRLVNAARQQNITLSVADVIQQPKLSALAKLVEAQSPMVQPQNVPIEAFSLLGGHISRDEAKDQAASLCNVEITEVEDIFPCTPLQAGLMAQSVSHPGNNVLTETLALRKDVDIVRLEAAWQRVIQANPILRTRIVDFGQQGLVQVVICYKQGEIEAGQTAQSFGLGTPLLSYQIDASGFTWSIHHALYDGWSLPLIFESLAQSYQSETVQGPPLFQAFVKHIQNANKAEAQEFWKDQFSDFNAQAFPILPSPTYKPKCDQTLQLVIRDVAWDGDYTAGTMIRLAWAILLATIMNSPDASFGTTVFGRQANIPGIEKITGPTFATVPLRIAIDRSKPVRELLQQVQLQAANMMPYEQFGLQNIQRINEDCNLGCQFQSLMIIQPGGKDVIAETLFEPKLVSAREKIDPLKLYAICLEFVLAPNSVLLRADYDSNVVSPTQFRRLAARFEGILRQLCSGQVRDQPLFLLNTSSLEDEKKIWSWNNTVLERSSQTVHAIFSQVAASQPEAPAVCSWDGEFTYGQVEKFSTSIAHELLRAGLPQTGQRIVPLFFEKSKWTSVCQLAVMKANGTSVGLDITLPVGRLQTVIDLVQPQIILASSEQEAKARQMAPSEARIIVVSDAHLYKLQHIPDLLPAVDPDTWLYVVFTSGSTGTPKGAIISHSNITSALKYGQAVMEFGPHSRTYDFVSYSFDVSWLNVLFTLCAGGCLCVPSQYEIQNEPKEAIARRRANTSVMTPTVGKLLHGSDLKVVNFGGENLPREEINYWKDRARIFHSYGPSECTPIVISHILDPERNQIVMGKGLGVRTWIVEPERGQSLAAVDDIGELWLEGPLVGQGYLGEPEKTEAAFFRNPTWLTKGGPGYPGRPGRLYRTGDLVRYDEDGSLRFMGRRDTQIKIRGQRVEIEEIEHHLSNSIEDATATEVVIDVVKPAQLAESVLVAFILPTDKTITPDTPRAQAYIQELAVSVRDRLSLKLARYMIPQGYVVVDHIPKTTSGKVDRGKLRKLASAMPKESLLQVARRAPETPDERKLYGIVAQVLARDEETFGLNNNFIQLGGDSISAMRLARMARESGFRVTVADILAKDRLAELLQDDGGAVYEGETPHVPFALVDVPHPSTFIKEKLMPQVQAGHGTLVDVLLATDMQSTYLRDNLHTPRRSWFYSYIDFAQISDEPRLIQSCKALVSQCDIYRTAFAHSEGSFYQLVFDSWEPVVNLMEDVPSLEAAFDKLVGEEMRSPVSLGAPLLQLTIIRARDRQAKLVFGMSHAIYDAISLGHTVQLLAEIYRGAPRNIQPFKDYVGYLHSRKADSYTYWRKTLQGSSMTRIPSIATPDGPPTVITRSIPMPTPPSGITPASLFSLACATALRRSTGFEDIVFGLVVSGRASVPASMANAVGPYLNRVPVRIQFTAGQSTTERLTTIQRQYTESLAHEGTGLSEIVQHCATHWPRDTTDFGCWIQYQNVEEHPMADLPGAIGGLGHKEMWTIPFAADFLEIFAIPGEEGTLQVRLIAGPGYAMDSIVELLEGVCIGLE
jgi:amino acid adenylation domain-containing protein